MIRVLAVNQRQELLSGITLEQIGQRDDIAWYWVDLSDPTPEETSVLEHHFHFHPLAIEDCLHLLQRPKLEHYEEVHFFVLHALETPSLKASEVNLFLGPAYLVSFHYDISLEVEEAWKRMSEQSTLRARGHIHAAYLIMDKIVDHYFPCVYEVEDQLNEIETKQASIHLLMKEVFEVRSRLLKLRRTIVPMRELLYRITNSDRISGLKDQLFYFTDIYDHLLKLGEIIETNREVSSDMRDNYISLNSNRANTIMKTLTVITTIFMPLTFIAGIYGMNFQYMPELTWKWGYFVALSFMFGIGLGMFSWFRRKGWFD
ncbi:magnesium/cobalt transporter CorA [Paenibacillus sp. GD4]|jgi:magnesium transporter|uniref:magnesium/cobalt transporter CorA n=1 Tax=Paenibacillus sp. GD4 TaxID=3068890 RepID=UPI00279651AD|nr:magnesium/cobalt transporter CorA [Paenibacillus sp. GD4]MDQ1912473.1 magnesium/cobalt transporter CorA [Paenibacillus sp. GD4]